MQLWRIKLFLSSKRHNFNLLFSLFNRDFSVFWKANFRKHVSEANLTFSFHNFPVSWPEKKKLNFSRQLTHFSSRSSTWKFISSLWCHFEWLKFLREWLSRYVSTSEKVDSLVLVVRFVVPSKSHTATPAKLPRVSLGRRGPPIPGNKTWFLLRSTFRWITKPPNRERIAELCWWCLKSSIQYMKNTRHRNCLGFIAEAMS